MSRFIFLLAIPTLLRAQVTSTLSGIPCDRLTDHVPTSTQIDSLRHRDPLVDADSAFALGELRLWSFNFGAEVPGTMGSMEVVDSIMARLDPSAATLPPHASAAIERVVAARAALDSFPGLRTFPYSGHMLVYCTRRAEDGTLVTDRGAVLWREVASAYVIPYNRRLLQRLAE